MNRWFRPLCRFRAPALKEALLAIQYLMPTEYTVGIKQSQLNYLNYGHKLMWDYFSRKWLTPPPRGVFGTFPKSKYIFQNF